MDFSSIVREARTSSGLTQATLAQKSGVSLNAIWELEDRGSGTVSLLVPVIQALNLRFAGLPRSGSFGEQVRALRRRRGWSQEQLAAKAGVSTPAIIRLERGNARIATLRAALRVLAPSARIRKPEVTHWGVGARDERLTPPDLLEKIERVVGSIDLDPCGHPESFVRAARVFYREGNGLAQHWTGRAVYINPPYSSAADYMRKAHHHWSKGDCQIVVALLQTQMHHQWVHKYMVGQADIFFLRGRIAFHRIGKPANPAPFGNMIAAYGLTEAMIDGMLGQFDCVHLSRDAKTGPAASRLSD